MIRKSDSNQIKIRYVGSIDIRDSSKKSFVNSNTNFDYPNPLLSVERKGSALQTLPVFSTDQENLHKPSTKPTKHYKEKRIRQYKISFAYTCSSEKDDKDINPKIVSLKRLDQVTTNSDHQFVSDKLKPVMSRVVQRLIQEYNKSKLNNHVSENEEKSISGNSISVSISGSENLLGGTLKANKLPHNRRSISPYLVNSYEANNMMEKNFLNLSIKGHSNTRTIQNQLKPSSVKQIRRLQKYHSSYKLNSFISELGKNESIEIVSCDNQNFISPKSVRDTFIYKKTKFLTNLDVDILKLFDKPNVSIYDLSLFHEFSSIKISNLIYMYSSIILNMFNQDVFSVDLENLLSYRRNIHSSQFALVKDVSFYNVEVVPQSKYACIMAVLENWGSFKQRSTLGSNYSNEINGSDINFSESSDNNVVKMDNLRLLLNSNIPQTSIVQQNINQETHNSMKTESIKNSFESESLLSDISIISDCPICRGDPIMCLEAEGRKSLIETYVNLLKESDGVNVKRLPDHSIDMEDLKALLYKFMAENDAYPSTKIKEEMIISQKLLMNKIQSGEGNRNIIIDDVNIIKKELIIPDHDKNRHLPQDFLKRFTGKISRQKISSDKITDAELDPNNLFEKEDSTKENIKLKSSSLENLSKFTKDHLDNSSKDIEKSTKNNFSPNIKNEMDNNISSLDVNFLKNSKSLEIKESSLYDSKDFDKLPDNVRSTNVVKDWIENMMPMQEAISVIPSKDITSNVIVNSQLDKPFSKVESIISVSPNTDNGLYISASFTAPSKQSLKVRQSTDNHRISNTNELDNEMKKEQKRSPNEVNYIDHNMKDRRNKIKTDSQITDQYKNLETKIDSKMTVSKVSPNGFYGYTEKELSRIPYLNTDTDTPIYLEIKEKRNSKDENIKSVYRESTLNKTKQIDQFHPDPIYVEVESKKEKKKKIRKTSGKKRDRSITPIYKSPVNPFQDISTFENSVQKAEYEQMKFNNLSENISKANYSQDTSDDFSGNYLNESPELLNLFNKISLENGQDIMKDLEVNKSHENLDPDNQWKTINQRNLPHTKYSNFKNVSSSFRASMNSADFKFKSGNRPYDEHDLLMKSPREINNKDKLKDTANSMFHGAPLLLQDNQIPISSNFPMGQGNYLEINDRQWTNITKSMDNQIPLTSRVPVKNETHFEIDERKQNDATKSQDNSFPLTSRVSMEKENHFEIEERKRNEARKSQDNPVSLTSRVSTEQENPLEIENRRKSNLKKSPIKQIDKFQIPKLTHSEDDLSVNRDQRYMSNKEIDDLLERLRFILSKSEAFLYTLSNLFENFEKRPSLTGDTINIPKDFYFLLKNICQNKDHNQINGIDNTVSNETAMVDLCKMLGLFDEENLKKMGRKGLINQLIDVKDPLGSSTKKSEMEELNRLFRDLLEKNKIDNDSQERNSYESCDENLIDKVVKCVLYQLLENNNIKFNDDHLSRRRNTKIPTEYSELSTHQDSSRKSTLDNSFRYLQHQNNISKSNKQHSPKFGDNFYSDGYYHNSPLKNENLMSMDISSVIDKCLPMNSKKLLHKKAVETKSINSLLVCDEIADRMRNLLMDLKRSQVDLRSNPLTDRISPRAGLSKFTNSERSLKTNSEDSKLMRSLSANCLRDHLLNPKPYASRHTVASIQNMVSTSFQKQKMTSGTRNIRKEIKDKSHRAYLNTKPRYKNLNVPNRNENNQGQPKPVVIRNSNNRKAFK